MKTGKLIRGTPGLNIHLGTHAWLEVFPRSAREIMAMHALAPIYKSYNEQSYGDRQSALLLRNDVAEKLNLKPNLFQNEDLSAPITETTTTTQL